MIGDASGGSGALFEYAQAGRGLARIEHFAIGPGYWLGKGAREGGNAAEALQEVEAVAFALEQTAGVAVTVGDGFAVADRDLRRACSSATRS